MKLLKRSLVLLGCALAAAAFTACELGLGGDDRYNPDAITGIELDYTGAKTTFQVGDTFSSKGVTVNAVKASGDKVDVTAEAKFSLAGKTFTSDDIGDTSCTVTYESFETSYDISIIGIVTAIKVTGIKANYVYNPGALETALEKAPDTAFEYEIEAIYEGGGTGGKLDAGLCKITYADNNITVSYNDITTTYSKDAVKSAISEYVVKSGDSIGVSECNTSWVASPDMVIPSGKTMVATFTNYGSCAEVWNNFLIEVLAGESGITLRADPYGWNFDAEKTADLDYADVTNSAGTTPITANLLNNKTIKVTAKNDGNNLTINCLSPDVEGWAMNYTVPLKSDTAKSSVKLHFNIDGSYLVFN